MSEEKDREIERLTRRLESVERLLNRSGALVGEDMLQIRGDLKKTRDHTQMALGALPFVSVGDAVEDELQASITTVRKRLGEAYMALEDSFRILENQTRRTVAMAPTVERPTETKEEAAALLS